MKLILARMSKERHPMSVRVGARFDVRVRSDNMSITKSSLRNFAEDDNVQNLRLRSLDDNDRNSVPSDRYACSSIEGSGDYRRLSMW